MPEQPIRILLVDDSEDYFLILEDLLLSIPDFHFTLKWASTVAMVYAVLQAEQYDLILMDYTLGRGQPTGVDLIRELVAAGVITPILVLTAEDDPRVDRAALAAGAVDYLTKIELTPQMLARAIRYAIARHQVESALRDERAVLERRVAERTADLSAANTELTRAARLKDEFLATISHELRTPLNAILGLSEALSESVYGALTTDQQKILHQIGASGQHLLAVINDILDLAKIGAGRMTLIVEPVALEPLCQDSLRLIQSMASQKRIAITCTLDPTVATLTADGRRLKQVLVNLLSNAVKFTPVGGTIGLDVIGDVPHRQVQLIIWDTGIGIAPEDQPRLFQLFVQLDSGLARQYDGCGLGLALVARITELHGGSVAVQSVKGQGSRFTITLPWHTPVADAPIIPDVDADHPHYQTVAEGSEAGLRPSPNSGLEPPVAAAPLILLAEDNEANIMTLADYLEVKGYRVVVARTGSEAITLARKVSPDMIVMDMHMPELDGLEATRRIRADAELAHIPIIAVTALAMPGDRERCLAAGANAYLSKPFSLKALVSMLAEYRATPVAT